jgi:putative sterol carrier protein
MSERLMYLSPEWRDEAEKRLKAELSPEKMNFTTSSMSNIYLNCPDGKERYMYFNFENGSLQEFAIGQGSPKDAEFKITGDYDVFVKISKAELGSQLALMSGKLKLKGNMVKALKLASVCDRLNKVLSCIPTEY